MDTKRKVAIFDIDGTIFRSSFLIELTEAFVRRGIFKPSVAKMYEREKQNWLDRGGDYEVYIRAVIVAFEKHIKGVKYSDFLAAAKEVLDVEKGRVYRYTRDLVRELKKKKYFVLAISQSPREIVRDFAASLGFDKVYGMFYELDQKTKKRFTGNILHLDLIFNKGEILKRAVELENLTLKGSVGVGDTASDISFLRLVERPICFNPNAKLYRHGKRAGWEIVVERKDVIYRL